MKNETQVFIGPQWGWRTVEVELADLRPGAGGIRLRTEEAAVLVTRVDPDGYETVYRLPIHINEKHQLLRACIRQDFVNIPSMAGRRSEARPEITLQNRDGQRYSVSKPANTVDERFGAIYALLLKWVDRAEAREPQPRPLVGSQRPLFLVAVSALIVLPIVGAALGALWVDEYLWPERIGLVNVWILVAAAGLPILYWRGVKSEWDVEPNHLVFTNFAAGTLMFVLYFLSLVYAANYFARAEFALRGVQTSGTIERLTEETLYNDDGGFTVDYVVRYRYDPAGGGPQIGRSVIAQRDYRQLTVNDEVGVYYDPLRPQRSRLAVQVEVELGEFMVFTVGGLLLTLFYLITFTLFGNYVLRTWEGRW